MAIAPVDLPTTSFSGEGITRRFVQGGGAVSGVAAHEALNVVVLRAQALRAGQEVVGEEVEVRFGINPETGRVEVVGGRSRVTFRPRAERPVAGAAAAAEADGTAGSDGASGADEAPAAEPIADADGDPKLRDARRVVDQASAAVRRRIEEIERARDAPDGDPVKADRTETELRALRQKEAQLEAARRELELREVAERMAELLQQVSQAQINGIAGLLRAGAAATGDGEGHRAPAPPQRARGVGIPAMTFSGLLVNLTA